MNDRVKLRNVSENDLKTLFEHQRQPEANEMAAFPAREREDFMAHWAKILADETVDAKAVLFDKRVAGNIVRFEQSGKSQVGYWIGQEYWGKGIATSALSQFVDLVEERPLYAFVAEHNLGSIRVLEKCGFIDTGNRHIQAGDDVTEFEFILEQPNSSQERRKPNDS